MAAYTTALRLVLTTPQSRYKQRLAKVLYIAKVQQHKKFSGSVAPKAMLHPPSSREAQMFLLPSSTLIASVYDMLNAAMAGCIRYPVAWDAVQPLTTAKLAKNAAGVECSRKVLLRRS